MKIEKIIKILIVIVIAVSIFCLSISFIWLKNIKVLKKESMFWQELEKTKIKSILDKDNDWIDDFNDILAWAKDQVWIVTMYDSWYYDGWFPPKDRWACSDIVWRSLKNAWYDFKSMLDEDIKKYNKDYPEIPPKNSKINFRRVQNIDVFLNKYYKKFTNELKPYDRENLLEWQWWDIVIFDKIPWIGRHIAILSDKRRKDWIPFVLDNHGAWVLENDLLTRWPSKVIWHYRFELKK